MRLVSLETRDRRSAALRRWRDRGLGEPASTDHDIVDRFFFRTALHRTDRGYKGSDPSERISTFIRNAFDPGDIGMRGETGLSPRATLDASPPSRMYQSLGNRYPSMSRGTKAAPAGSSLRVG